jgi:hypothetical protein
VEVGPNIHIKLKNNNNRRRRRRRFDHMEKML